MCADEMVGCVVGSVGDAISVMVPDVYISDDGGYSWMKMLEGPHYYTILDSGGIIVAIEHSSHPINVIKYAWAQLHPHCLLRGLPRDVFQFAGKFRTLIQIWAFCRAAGEVLEGVAFRATQIKWLCVFPLTLLANIFYHLKKKYPSLFPQEYYGCIEALWMGNDSFSTSSYCIISVYWLRSPFLYGSLFFFSLGRIFINAFSSILFEWIPFLC